MGDHEVHTPLKLRITGELRDEDLTALESALVQRYRRSIRAGSIQPVALGAVEHESQYMIGQRIREAKYQVHRLEVALRTGDPIDSERSRSAIGAIRLAQRHLERLIQPDGRTRIEAAVRALERAASLVSGPDAARTPAEEARGRAHRLVAAVEELLANAPEAPAPEPRRAPLKRGWHLIVDDTGAILGYLEVVDSTYRRWYDRDLEYVDGTDVSIESEGLGPLEYLAGAAVAGQAAVRITGALAARLARSFAARALRRAALAGAVMAGVAEAAPVVGGKLAQHAFLLSDTLAADVAVLEARAAARPAAGVAAEAEAAGAGATMKPPLPRAAATGTGGSAGAVSPSVAGMAVSGAPRYAASLGEQAEADVLRRYHPSSYSVPPKFRAYDAYEGGTVETFLTRERGRGRWILVVNQVVSGARWISLKRILARSDVTPENVAAHVDSSLRAIERDAADRSGRRPSRDPEPVDEDTYFRVIKKDPARVTLHITYEGEVPAPLAEALAAAAREAALKSGRLGDLPPLDILINGRNVPLR